MKSIMYAAAIFGVMAGLTQGSLAQSCEPVRAAAALTPNYPGTVNMIASYDDGSELGRTFYIGGGSGTLGGVGRLTSSGWTSVGSLSGTVSWIGTVEDGTGPGGRAGLYAGGSFSGFLARWDGTTWQRVTPAPSAAVYAVSALPDAAGHQVLHVVAGGTQFQRLENGVWRTLGIINGAGRWTDRVVSFDEDGAGPRPPAIFMGSGIIGVTDQTVTPSVSIPVQSGLLRWDGTTFTALPAAGNMGNWIKAMALYDDGINGMSLFVSGHGTAPLGPILRWDTTTQTWVRPGPALTGAGDTAYGMAVLKDGVGTNTDRTRLYGIGQSWFGLSTPPGTSAALNQNVWQSVTIAPAPGATSFNYHFPAASGELGAGHVPAILSVSALGSGMTGLFALVGCPRCAADLDLDGQATVGDIFMYVEAFFSGATLADTNRSGTVTLQDLFDYLGSYFAGCS